MTDLINDVRREAGQSIALRVAAELERLQAAKRAALAIANERSAENVKLRATLKPFVAWIDKVDAAAPNESAIAENRTCLINGAAVVTYGDFRAARAALGEV